MKRTVTRRGSWGAICCTAALACVWVGSVAHAKELGDILVEKGLITADELKQAREEEKQKTAAEESRREMIAAKLPKWLEMITPFGDIRLREEGFYSEDLNARNRGRMRARFGLNINPHPEIGATFRLASGNPDDPISTNQSFERTFTRKPVNLDQAYLTLKPGKSLGIEPGWLMVRGGKMPVGAYRVSELVFDDDLQPEGATETLNLVEEKEGFLRGLKVNAFQWVVDEIASAGDPWMAGGQIVADAAFSDKGPLMTVAFADYHYDALDKVARKFLEKSSSSFNGQLANSNGFTKDADGKITGFDSAFNIVNGGGEVNFSDVFGTGLGAGLFGEVAYNTQASSGSTGFATGFGFGKGGRDWYHNDLKNQGDWAISYTYERVGKDAVLALFSYSDIDYVQPGATQKGSTNVSASIIRIDYVLLPSFQLTAKAHFINALDRGDSNAALVGNSTLIRTQLDAVFKF